MCVASPSACGSSPGHNPRRVDGRGVAGSNGRAAHLRVNDRSYLTVYEARSGAMWRLETTGHGAHHGLVAEGTAESFEDAKVAVREALRGRFPDAARSVDASVQAPVAPHHGWVPLQGGRDDRTEGRVFDERVAAMISPGPGGRWETWVLTDGRPSQGPLAASADDARLVADALGRGALMTVAAAAPDRANTMIRDLADAGTLTRGDLDGLLGARLTEPDRVALTAPNTPPDRLVELLGSTGAVGPATVVAVLHHEGVEAATVAGLIPAIGMPIPDAVRELHDRWGMDRISAGAHLAATPDDLRAAGCTTIEMLQAAPREVLRQLDTRTHTWELAAHTLLEAGMSPGEAVRQLALHAPTPDTFAAGVYEIQPDPASAFPVAVPNKRARPRRPLGALRPLPRRDGRDPQHRVRHPATLVHVVHGRCDGDMPATLEACAAVLPPGDVADELGRDPVVTSLAAARSGGAGDEFEQLRDDLGAPSESSALDITTDHGLVAALDAAGARHDDLGLERDERE